MEGLMLDVQLLISTVLDRVGTRATKFLNEEDAKALCAILCDEGIQNPFFGLHNTYQQTKYYREHLGLNVSFILFVSYSVLPLFTRIWNTRVVRYDLCISEIKY